MFMAAVAMFIFASALIVSVVAIRSTLLLALAKFSPLSQNPLMPRKRIIRVGRYRSVRNVTFAPRKNEKGRAIARPHRFEKSRGHLPPLYSSLS
jgi:hypothetical protein